ncbi:hypothetical protein DSM106972_048190 [Dulcicalothrix desertica PCC 7102]|uniref:Uncharacterized protein n=1 Tax=Dulcicalothrix desertica PCC 7102 TaxID=232991 RepID=A0A3S1D5J2_9CYAN|nr:hypothetical protein [Dulcicalothrix desertica]RUT03905.1 hypothetical protein DSM106972_048190 [Dulcicalothrix desertica PCC 7102]TWH43685.1 hypothetical protein CAL7102_07428 [Dulcicalothrix desertica PCC 7102]
MLSIPHQKKSNTIANKDLIENPTEPYLSSTIPQKESPKKASPQLSMIWVKKFDGTRDCLVAKWVTSIL